MGAPRPGRSFLSVTPKQPPPTEADDFRSDLRAERLTVDPAVRHDVVVGIGAALV